MTNASDVVNADVAIVGAGPAGVAAAVRAAESGARVVVVDESPDVGGNIWRHGPAHPAPVAARHWTERLERSSAKTDAERAAAPHDVASTLERAATNDIALAVQMLERASQERAPEVMEKLGPLIKANCARLGIGLEELVFLLQSRP